MATAFRSLVPTAEDNMEMSSPAGRPLDDDIDIDAIDYDFDGGGGVVQDDDHMQEDITRPSTANDEMMQDDQTSNIDVPEAEMSDDEQAFDEQDDELIDFEDEFPEEEPDRTVTDVLSQSLEVHQDIETQEQQGEPPRAGPSESDGANVNLDQQHHMQTMQSHSQGNIAGLGTVQQDHTHETITENEPTLSKKGSSPALSLTAEAERNYQLSTPPHEVEGPPVSAAAPEVETETRQSTDQTDVAEPEQGDQEGIAETGKVEEIPAEGEAKVDVDGPGTPTDTGLHSMIVHFSGYEMPLFKSRNQPEGLLKDDNLASLSLSELMQNVRQRLTVKTGEELSEDQELTLGFESLGCFLVENSRPTFETSLNDILEVFLQLHENDGVDDVPPLHLSFSLQLKFTSHLAALKQAAAGGQGMSAFAYLQSSNDETDYDGHYTEDLEAGPYPEVEEEPYQGDDATFEAKDGREGYVDYPEAESHEQYVETSGHGNDPDHNEDEEDDFAENLDEADQLDPSGGRPPLGGESNRHDTSTDQVEESLAEVHQSATAHDEAEGSANGALSAVEGGEIIHEPSDASSSTVRGDTRDGLNEQTYEGDDDFETFVNESGIEAQEPDTENHLEYKQVSPRIGQDSNVLEEDQDRHAYEMRGDQEKNHDLDHTQHVEEEGFADPDDEATHSNFFTDALHDGEYHQEDEDFDAVAEKEHPDDSAVAQDEDSIDFDDDTEEQHAARKASEANIQVSPKVVHSTGSPNGKRSYDDHVDEDEIDFESPQVKKFRAE